LSARCPLTAGCAIADPAVTHVERDVTVRSLLPFMLVDPMLDPLHALPRFKALLAK
jgi:hypothetical protein